MSTDTTAIKDFIEWMKEFKVHAKNLPIDYAVSKATELLSKEKNQIITAYQQGMNDGEYPATIGRGMIYYENTYQQ